MEKKLALQILAGILVLGMLSSTLNITAVFASETIYILPDGSVAPSTAPIQRFGDLYTFTADINASIVIQRDNIIVDGYGYRLQGTGIGLGFDVSYRSNVTIRNTEIVGFDLGIYLIYSDRNTIIDNTILRSTGTGIFINYSDYNSLVSNLVSNSICDGIYVYESIGTKILGNTITNNTLGNYEGTSGVWMQHTIDNVIAGNILTHNLRGAAFADWMRNSSVLGNTITSNGQGIRIGGWYTETNPIMGNIITNNTGAGIRLDGDASYSDINRNIIKYNSQGIILQGFDITGISATNNTIENNGVGVATLTSVGGNRVFHNNFIDNSKQADTGDDPILPPNYWDNGYPSGGNYWNDYEGTDNYTGPCQNLTGSDGIGDTPYIISEFETVEKDRYPLMTIYGTPTHFLTVSTTGGGTTNPSPGTYFYTVGSVVTVTATPKAAYSLDHWELDNVNIGSANPISINMDANHALHAVFQTTALQISTTSGGTTNPPPGVHLSVPGSIVAVTAIPELDFLLDRWELDGTIVDSVNPIAVTMDINHALHAVFREKPDITVTAVSAYPTSVRRGEPIYINVTVENKYGSAETFNVVAYADKDKGVIGDEIIVGTQTVYNLVQGSTKTLNFVWDTSTVPLGTSYYISAKAIVPYDRQPSDNLLTAKKKVIIRH